MDTGKESKPSGQKRSWSEKEGVICFSVTSNGMTGQRWLDHFKAKGTQIEALAKRAILSFNFTLLKGEKLKIVILKGDLFNDSGWTVGDIRAFAAERHFTIMSVETACLIRDMFKDDEIAGVEGGGKEMDLSSVIFMHETARDSSGNPFWLTMDCEFGGDWLGACYNLPDFQKRSKIGFAFVDLSVDPQN